MHAKPLNVTTGPRGDRAPYAASFFLASSTASSNSPSTSTVLKRMRYTTGLPSASRPVKVTNVFSLLSLSEGKREKFCGRAALGSGQSGGRLERDEREREREREGNDAR